MMSIHAKDVFNLAKFFVVFFLSFIIGQLFKNPLEAQLINSDFIHKVPLAIEILLLALPNLFFYTFVGIGLSIVIRERILFWLIVFCIFELLWQLYFLHPRILDFGGFSGYMLVYFRKIVIPVAFILGGWIHKNMWDRWVSEK